MRFNVITGLPRSGSTLLCNVLNQNPRFRASSTSALGVVVAATSHQISASPETKSDLAHNREATEARIERVLRGIILNWYSEHIDKDITVFDKGRAWAHQANVLTQLVPDANLIVCVRDLRAVFGSIERRHLRFPALNSDIAPSGKTIAGRADQAFDADAGVIGLPVQAVIDLADRRFERAIIWQYEYFIAQPEQAMRRLYADLGEEWFDHSFDAVEDTSTDLDALYLGKFPHHNSNGAVSSSDEDEWRMWVPTSIEKLIMSKFAGYNTAFGYR